MQFSPELQNVICVEMIEHELQYHVMNHKFAFMEVKNKIKVR
jgi:hypothetical protein